MHASGATVGRGPARMSMGMPTLGHAGGCELIMFGAIARSRKVDPAMYPSTGVTDSGFQATKIILHGHAVSASIELKSDVVGLEAVPQFLHLCPGRAV